MRVVNPPAPACLDREITSLLGEFRKERGFNAEQHIKEKAALLNDYLRHHRLSACIVALSGGIDSAVVLALAACAAREPDSPIKRLLAVLAPVHSVGATNQGQATTQGQEIAASCNGQQTEGTPPVETVIIDLTEAHKALKETVDQATSIKGEGWATGQLVAYARTPAFYYITSLLTQQGFPAVLLGTTNRDEGAYLGYVGKAADGMVDLQLIADLHKGEVRQLAQALNLPSAVCMATPTGDMYDGRPDEEVFGAPYDFVELYLNYLCLPKDRQKTLLCDFTPEARKQFKALASHLEKLHTYNQHKYLARSPAIHLNILPSAVPGGWEE